MAATTYCGLKVKPRWLQNRDIGNLWAMNLHAAVQRIVDLQSAKCRVGHPLSLNLRGDYTIQAWQETDVWRLDTRHRPRFLQSAAGSVGFAAVLWSLALPLITCTLILGPFFPFLPAGQRWGGRSIVSAMPLLVAGIAVLVVLWIRFLRITRSGFSLRVGPSQIEVSMATGLTGGRTTEARACPREEATVLVTQITIRPLFLSNDPTRLGFGAFLLLPSGAIVLSLRPSEAEIEADLATIGCLDGLRRIRREDSMIIAPRDYAAFLPHAL